MDDFFVRNRLSAYLDGELPTSEAREVEAALARNAALRAEYEQLRELVEQLRADGPLASPPRLKARLAERLAAEPMPARWRRWMPRVPLEGLALAAIALFALVLVSKPKAPTPPASPAPVPAVGAEAAPVAGTPTPGAPADTVAAANGVLGDEARPLNTAGRQSMGEPKKMAPSSTYGGRSGAEKEPALQAWEAGPVDNTAGAETNTAAKTELKAVGTVPPYRYRLRTNSDAALKTLAAVAVELGGKLVDERGRALATYPMETGDARSVRVVVPSYNVEALHTRLREMGDVETMASDASVLYAAGADVPIAVEVERE